MSNTSLTHLLKDIRACTHCTAHLPLGPNPTLRAHEQARILIAGQAPGIRVHQTSIPWNDPSGDRLRDWLQVDREQFYDGRQFAIIPAGFCYPGTGKSGDLPPRPECAELWLQKLLNALPQIELILAIGSYAQALHIPTQQKTLTETVRAWQEYQPRLFPLPHPSPRNNLWLRRNPWFENEVIPALRDKVHTILVHNDTFVPHTGLC